MNLQKLYVGQIIKNYNAMCEILEETVLKGNSQISQIKEWQRYFKFNKQGHKYIIEEVYDMPTAKKDKRISGNNSIYIKYIETILLYLLSGQTDQTMVCTKNYLLVALGITGRKYIDKRYRHGLITSEEFEQKDLDEFDSRTYKFLDKILFRALDNLHNRCLLDWQQELHITYYEDMLEKSITRPATVDEIRKFTAIKLDIMQKFGLDEGKPNKYDSLRDIYLNHQTEKFYTELNKRILDELEWENTGIFYNLIFTKKNVIEAIPRTEQQLQNYLDNKSELNSTVVQALNKSIETHYNNNITKFSEAVENQKWIYIDQYKLKSDYILIQQNLTKKLIQI